MSVTPQPDPRPDEPLDGVLTPDEIRELEATGRPLRDVIREIEETVR